MPQHRWTLRDNNGVKRLFFRQPSYGAPPKLPNADRWAAKAQFEALKQRWARQTPATVTSLTPRLAEPRPVVNEQDKAGAELTRIEGDLKSTLPKMEAKEIARSALRPIAGQKIHSGTKPIFFLEDETGKQYVFKAAPKHLVAAEVMAHEIRTMAGRPSLPVIADEREFPEIGRVAGMLKPVFKFDGSKKLSDNPSEWSPMQREAMLKEHPWEWLLENLDTHTGQYVLWGAGDYPFNFDWDRSFHHECKRHLSRFARHRPLLPSVRNFLYESYVKGEIDLDFQGMLAEAQTVADLPESRLQPTIETYARSRYSSSKEQADFVRRVMQRKRGMRREFETLVSSLEAERAERSGKAKRSKKLELLVNEWKDALQHGTFFVQQSPVTTKVRKAKRDFEAKRTAHQQTKLSGEAAPADLFAMLPKSGQAKLRLELRDAMTYSMTFGEGKTISLEVPASPHGTILNADLKWGTGPDGQPVLESVKLNFSSGAGTVEDPIPLESEYLPRVLTPATLVSNDRSWKNMFMDKVASLAMRNVEISQDGEVGLEGELRLMGGLVKRPVNTKVKSETKADWVVELERLARGMFEAKPDMWARVVTKAVVGCRWEVTLSDGPEDPVRATSTGELQFRDSYGISGHVEAGIEMPEGGFSMHLDGSNDGELQNGMLNARIEAKDAKGGKVSAGVEDLRWDAMGAKLGGLDIDKVAPVALVRPKGQGRAPQLGSTAFLERLDSVLGEGSPVHRDNQVRFLKSGDQLHEERLKLIGRATAGDTLLLQTFIFQNDTSGREVSDALIAAKKRGADVRVMLDGAGALNGAARDLFRGSRIYRRLKKHGIPVVLVKDPRKAASALLKGLSKAARSQPDLGKKLRAAGGEILGWLWDLAKSRRQRREFLQDPLKAALERAMKKGSIAAELEAARKVLPEASRRIVEQIFGSGDAEMIGRQFVGLFGRDHRKRLMLYGERQEGPIAELLMGGDNIGDEYDQDPRLAAERGADHARGFLWLDADLHIRGRDLVEQDAQDFARTWREAGGAGSFKMPPPANEVARAMSGPGLPLRLIQDRPPADATAPGDGKSHFSNFLLATLEGLDSGDRLCLESPYLVLLPEIHRAMLDAARRGAKISIVTNGPYKPNDAVMVAEHTRWFHTRALIQEGIEVFERQLGASPIHQKSVLAFDRKGRSLYAVGTPNADQLSARFNREAFVVGGTIFGESGARESIEDGLMRSFHEHSSGDGVRHMQLDDLGCPPVKDLALLYARAVLAPIT